jgi:TolB protein
MRLRKLTILILLALPLILALSTSVPAPSSPRQLEATAEATPLTAVPPDEVAPTSTPEPTANPPPLRTEPAASEGAVVASVYRNERWDIYELNLQGQLQRRLTFGAGDSRAPSWSRDGKRIAFESHANSNWDIYVVDADGSNLTRLTTHPRFDGSPRWSPDGQRIAFTSDRDGTLDIWLMNADGTNPVNLTPQSPGPDVDPSWSPDGRQIAFTSRRDGNKEIYLMNADGSNPRNLTRTSSSDEEQPVWSPDRQRIAFVSGGRGEGPREIYALEAAAPQQRQRITALQYHQWPAWSPDSSGLLFVSQAESFQSLQWVQPGQPTVTLTHDASWYRQPDWNVLAIVSLDQASLAGEDAPLYIERTTPNPPSRSDRYNLVDLNDVQVIVPKLSDAVDGSFVALRQRVLAESGWDFLNRLSETVRPLGFKSVDSDYLSWHKSGRAMDLLLDFFTAQGHAMEVAREDVRGETYWRIYLRAAKQDGSQGEPLRDVLWDVSAGARQRAFPRGGMIKVPPTGYYIDLTELARQYGWRRIASHLDWRTNFYGLEYWHYEKSDGLDWWTAIREIYTPEELGQTFSYTSLLKARYPVLTMIIKGIPAPVDILTRYSSFVP